MYFSILKLLKPKKKKKKKQQKHVSQAYKCLGVTVLTFFFFLHHSNYNV